MITDEDHPRMKRAYAELYKALQAFTGQNISGVTLHGILTTCADHRARWRQTGVDFPVLTALIVPRIGAVALLRADLHGEPLRIRILGFIRQNPEATTEEVAEAVKRAFPDYRPPQPIKGGIIQ